MYTIWIGGIEINDYLLDKEQANYLADYWIKRGYDDVQIEKIN